MSLLQKRNTTNLFVIHCSATPPTMDIGVKEITDWHKKKGWVTVGYHFIIRRDGTLEVGRPVDTIGAHALGVNNRSVGICMVGGVDEHNKAENNFTPKQWARLQSVLVVLQKKYLGCEIKGHNQIDHSRACPSFSVPEYLKKGPLQNVKFS